MLPVSGPSRNPYASSSSPAQPARAQQPLRPADIAASRSYAERAGGSLFLSGSWYAELASALTPDEQTMLGAMLDHVQRAGANDPLQVVANTVRFQFRHAGGPGPTSSIAGTSAHALFGPILLDATCTRSANGEITGIRIASMSGTTLLHEKKPEAQPVVQMPPTPSGRHFQQELTQAAIKQREEQKLADLGVTAEQIQRLGEPKSREMVIKYLPALSRKNFSVADVVKIGSKIGSEHAFKTVLGNADRLIAKNISIKNITRIAGNTGGGPALQAFVDTLEPLEGKGFSKSEIIGIAAHNGGRQALEKLLASMIFLKNDETFTKATVDFLRDEEKFTTSSIARIAGTIGSAQAIDTIISNLADLRAKDFSNDDITDISSNVGGAHALTTVLEKLNALKAKKLDHAQIVRIASYGGAANTLTDIADQPWERLMTPEELIKLTSYNSASVKLNWVMQHYQTLRDAGVEKAAILSLATARKKGVREKALAAAASQAAAGSSTAQPAEAGPSSKSKGKRRAEDNRDSPPKAIKLEPGLERDGPGLVPAPVTGMQVESLNTAQSRYVPTTTYAQFDLTGEGGPVMSLLTVRDTDSAMVISGKQAYDPALDKMFPIRDPANPNQVHPAYAQPGDPTRCADAVQVREVKFYKSGSKEINEDTLWQHARENFDTPYTSKDDFMTALRQACLQELRAILAGEAPPSCRDVHIDKVKPAQCDDPAEAKALAGQYGGVLADYAPARQPSLGNARVVCLFAGARLASQQDDDAYEQVFGREFSGKALHDYGANVRKRGARDTITWAPYGGGNMGQYFNTAVAPHQPNAILCPLTFELTDASGRPTPETMLAVFLTRPVEHGKQIKLNYGPRYQLAPAPEPMDLDDDDLVPVKIEPMEE